MKILADWSMERNPADTVFNDRLFPDIYNIPEQIQVIYPWTNISFKSLNKYRFYNVPEQIQDL